MQDRERANLIQETATEVNQERHGIMECGVDRGLDEHDAESQCGSDEEVAESNQSVSHLLNQRI